MPFQVTFEMEDDTFVIDVPDWEAMEEIIDFLDYEGYDYDYGYVET